MKLLNSIVAAMALIFAFSTVSCSDDDTPNADRVIHIYLSVPDGKNSIADDSDEAVTVQVSLSDKLATDLRLDFSATGDASLITLSDNPVVIPAGQTTGFFTVKSAKSGKVTEATSLSFELKDFNGSNLCDIATNTTVTILPATSLADLTAEQRAMIATWRTKYGIDLAPWVGNISLEGTIEFPGGGNRAAFTNPETIKLSGATAFTISADATDEVPALDMLENPMGMSDYLYKTLRALTVADPEYFALEADGTGLELMKLIEWNVNSTETFGVSLSGLKLTSIKDGKATIEFVKEGEDLILDSKGQPIKDELMDGAFYTYQSHTNWIPFSYNFTAWNRQLGLMEAGNPTALELQSYGVTAAPGYYLGVSDVLEDAWEIDPEEDGTPNYYVKPHAEIDFNAGTMTFVFPFDAADQYGYSRVTVTYSLKK